MCFCTFLNKRRFTIFPALFFLESTSFKKSLNLAAQTEAHGVHDISARAQSTIKSTIIGRTISTSTQRWRIEWAKERARGARVVVVFSGGER